MVIQINKTIRPGINPEDHSVATEDALNLLCGSDTQKEKKEMGHI